MKFTERFPFIHASFLILLSCPICSMVLRHAFLLISLIFLICDNNKILRYKLVLLPPCTLVC
jgi:hypothetical protein